MEDVKPFNPLSSSLDTTKNLLWGDNLKTWILNQSHCQLDVFDDPVHWIYPSWPHATKDLANIWKSLAANANVMFDIRVTKGNRFVGSRMLIWNERGQTHSLNAVLLDFGYGFDTTATVVSPDANVGYRTMRPNTDRTPANWRILSKLDDVAAAEKDDEPAAMTKGSRFDWLLRALADTKYQDAMPNDESASLRTPIARATPVPPKKRRRASDAPSMAARISSETEEVAVVFKLPLSRLGKKRDSASPFLGIQRDRGGIFSTAPLNWTYGGKKPRAGDERRFRSVNPQELAILTAVFNRSYEVRAPLDAASSDDGIEEEEVEEVEVTEITEVTVEQEEEEEDVEIVDAKSSEDGGEEKEEEEEPEEEPIWPWMATFCESEAIYETYREKYMAHFAKLSSTNPTAAKNFVAGHRAWIKRMSSLCDEAAARSAAAASS